MGLGGQASSTLSTSPEDLGLLWDLQPGVAPLSLSLGVRHSRNTSLYISAQVQEVQWGGVPVPSLRDEGSARRGRKRDGLGFSSQACHPTQGPAPDACSTALPLLRCSPFLPTRVALTKGCCTSQPDSDLLQDPHGPGPGWEFRKC